MNNNPKDSLNCSEAVTQQYEDSFILDVLPQITTESASTKYILIKHDYYSTDSAHGREMLMSFFKGIQNSNYSNLVIYLIDKGTCLLDKDNILFDSFNSLLSCSEMIIAARESIETYSVNCDSDPKLIIRSMDSLVEELILLSGILVLE